jgi:multidrug efflux pump subunit AcrB
VFIEASILEVYKTLAITAVLVLVAVFVPITFMQGNTGRLFSEFAIALAGAVCISSLVALTLSPMMCSRILKPQALGISSKCCSAWKKS